MNRLYKYFLPALIFFMLASVNGFAQGNAEPTADSGDTAWILTSTALVLFMTIPGLSLYYAGLVRGRNVLSVLMQCFAITAMMTVIWLVYGYSLAFSSVGMVAGETNLHSFIGGLDKMFLKGITADTLSGTIPEVLFFAFQMTFVIITPALIVGAFVERMKFSAMMIFTAIWATIVYLPVCHMVWGGDGGFFADRNTFDFSGGIVVHITAGVAALVVCIMVGPRKGYPKTAMPPHNLPMTVTGAGMLWVGWFGFNAGSAVAADGSAAMALVVTQVSAAMATLAWMGIEWIKHGKPSVLGAATGAIAGLAAITPASGYVGPVGALCIGFASGSICWWASTVIKSKFGYDDSLDVFGVHGVGGFLGTVLVAVFASSTFGGNEGGLENYSIGGQLGTQTFAAVIVVIYTLVLTIGILKGVDAMVGLRVDEKEENEGLDLASHGEQGYND
ncbi:MAG TPA: ammonium transporter [Verrucomicrobiales bacterium]|nr:ammonium transporter [Verrucomicrobiales bacterium]HIL70868.1 ammonium transporter [Verrucomicrobiota bacterium]